MTYATAIKWILVAAGFVLFSTQAQAISRYNSKSLTCHQAHSLIARKGAVIIRYRSKRNRSLTLYDRFVANVSKCAYGERTAIKTVPTSDNSACRLLFCRPSTGGGGRRSFGGGVKELCTIDAVRN